jgi:hypothetical protein
MTETPNDLITATAARKILGVSPLKMTSLLKQGRLRTWMDPLDNRKKLVSRAEVEALRSPRERAA